VRVTSHNASVVKDKRAAKQHETVLVEKVRKAMAGKRAKLD
jgi:hypothetical protein